ncbi:MAG: hypothetical protein BGO01_13885 [Armatimonadetes bacterium 55-13]|nr:hypothetical protein [Armatimonadota bacterium]OJU64812.1 MAG: hypothetical protein BGO01_13885 [Armatimonadetes bacterium 55-13]
MYFVVGVILGIAVGYAYITIRNRREQSRFFAISEYWVYIPGEELPSQDKIMNLVLQGGAPVGTQEGLLFSDIRLHVALVLRAKNPHVFRPDIIADHITPTAEVLTALASSKAMIKIRYASEIRLKSDAHLQLLPYLSYAYQKLGEGLAVYDVNQERLMTKDEFTALLKANTNTKAAEFNIQTVWRPAELGGRVESRGLIKKGLPELVTDDVRADEKMLVESLVEEAARKIWTENQIPDQVEIESYDDRFQILVSPPSKGRARIRIMRLQTI